ncbi:MAG TPA: 1,4-alpha-glucan branching protein GlgB [Sporichthyaceae bacterium]|jgi:1,4-alpha-glucan branching enzyme|nr:1,4-alpha-glucan branching protein GlgB [Sporichthyaceae bacterium]
MARTQSENGARTVAADVQPLDPAEAYRLRSGTHHDPHSVLGPHPHSGAVTVRVLRPHATGVSVLVGGKRFECTPEGDGLFATVVPGDGVPDYRLEVTYNDDTFVVDDPYRFWPTLGEMDLYLIGEGRHERLWDVLGAHIRHYGGPTGEVVGTSFAVWAPNARGARLLADFNYWDGTGFPMRSLGSSGVWELFVPDTGPGTRYKFALLGADGRWREKADPFAFATETPPATASVVHESRHEWDDSQWMRDRVDNHGVNSPMAIYEVHLGSWHKDLTYRQLADQLVGYVRDLGFTHVELLPPAEHPFGGSWGYQVSSYFAPTARFGGPDDFRLLVDRLHQAGIGVIIDWVPAHFPRDDWALAEFDGTDLYEHPDPRRGEQPDWGTLVFNFGRNEVRNFLVANACYWLEEYHVDGLRVDAVASMLYLDYSRKDGEWAPNAYGGRENLEAVAFLQEMNATVYKRVPGAFTVAEESTAWPGVTRPTHLGGLGFGFKWNMGWMHDSLSYMSHDPVHRAYHHNEMTFSMMYAWSENFVLPLSHDEMVHGKGSLFGKMPGDRWQKLANLRAYLAFMWAHPGKKLLFMGAELGQEAEWSESGSLDWWLLQYADHAGMQHLVRDLNRTYRDTPALWELDASPEGFAWIDANDSAGNVFSFVRRGTDGSSLACVSNFANTPRSAYRIGLPRPGRWTEVVNTDAVDYSGSGVGNLGGVDAGHEPWHGMPASVELTLPPLATVWLRNPAAE